MPGLEDDLRAAVHADHELGRDYEADVDAHAFAERLDAEIDRRVQERLDARVARQRRDGAGFDFLGVLLALGSIGIAVGVPSAMHGHVRRRRDVRPDARRLGGDRGDQLRLVPRAAALLGRRE